MKAPGRHEQLLRIFHLIDLLLAARRPLSADEIKTALRERGAIDEMSDRNVRRDIEFLVAFGYDVREETHRTGRGSARKAWRIAPAPGKSVPAGPAVTVPELLSLAVARDFLVPLAGTCYWRGIGRLVQRIERLATPALLEYVDGHREGLVVHPRPTAGKYPVRLLNAVHRAIRRSLELVIVYRKAGDERARRVTVRPEALVVYDGSIYLAARKAEGKEKAADPQVRFYKLDRCSSARVGKRPFVAAPGKVEDLLGDSITIYRSAAPPRRFRIRVSPSRARWACEKPFHPRQTVVEEADGGVVLEIERAWEEELVPQLLGLADEAEVLEPADVRGRILDTARRIAARYEQGTPAPTPAPRRPLPRKRPGR